jgi:hypothetical protein
MHATYPKNSLTLAVAAALGAMAVAGTPADVDARGKTQGKYVAGDFHNHSTCSDGSTSMQKLVKKSIDKTDTPWGLDWFVQAGHGGTGSRNCTLVEDATLATPAYPFLTGPTPFDVPTASNPSPSQYTGPSTTWAQSIGAANIKGATSGAGATQNMWRWQSIQEYQYQVMEYLNAYLNKPLFLGLESVVAGHEHTSMSVITGQIPAALNGKTLPSTPGYTALGNANALAMWTYCFDRATSDTSRGNTTTTSGIGNNWDCSVTGSLNNADVSWNDAAKKLIPSGTDVGIKGHNKTVEALKWMKEFHPEGSYYVPAHLERAGPFNPQGNNGFNVEHLRNFNNAAPRVAFGMETQPGHGASGDRGEYRPNRNNIGGVLVDSVGGTTYGGTGVYGAQIGGVWDALLGEGRNWWFFANSDWHNRGSFAPDDRRSTNDFYPGEYQRNYTMVRNGGNPKLSPQEIVDGLRTGNVYADSGQLIDRLAFVACAANPGRGRDDHDDEDRFGHHVRGGDDDRDDHHGRGGQHGRADRAVEVLTLLAARQHTDLDIKGCATMGEKLVVRPGSDVIVAIAVRDPAGTSYAPYSFNNPSLLQIGVKQPLNKPVLDHIDVIGGKVTGYRQPGAPDYAGAWPNDWLAKSIAGTASLADVPAAAKNTTAGVLRTFNKATWWAPKRDSEYKVMSFRLKALKDSQYVRLRGTNLPASVPFETDADGNPLPDIYTNVIQDRDTSNLKIKCTATGLNVPANDAPQPAGAPAIDGCPNHLPVVNGEKYVAFDVAAWSDLWFYSNPIFIEVRNATKVAGVQ